ncbi:MAG: hypothetical protein JW759_04225 [Candidatus Coatesbacteria bacterium]|nr:hypothetical protein [Candidatus Coatesbacteria bacterium]
MRFNSFLWIAALFLMIAAFGCSKEHGMYEGSQISATIMLLALYAFSFVCIVGSLLRLWGMRPLLAGAFVLACCTIMLLMTPYLWLGAILLIVGLITGYMAFRRLRGQSPSASS